MKRIIFSGFYQFGEYTANTTEIIAKEIRGVTISGFMIQSVIFEPSVANRKDRVLGRDRTLTLFDMASLIGAKGIVSMGMASEKTGLCVESRAVNRIYSEKYVAADLNDTPIKKSRPYNEELKLNLEPWNVPVFQETCRARNIPVMEVSDDAGGFCCNQLMYEVLAQQSEEQTQIPFIFIHIPCSQEAVPDLDAFTKAGKVTMKVDQVIRGLELLLNNVSL